MVGAGGRRQENNPVNCFLPTETEILWQHTSDSAVGGIKFPVPEA